MPINFDEANVIVEVPEPNGNDMTYKNYPGLQFKNNLNTDCLLTCWMPNKEDIESILAGKPVCILQMTNKGFNTIHLYTSDNIL